MIDADSVRKDFPILLRKVNGRPLVYLDNAATTQKPRQVIDAISGYYERHNANVHRGVHTLSQEATDMAEEARDKVASFLGAANREEVVFVRNATEAINLVLYSWGTIAIRKGDSIVISLAEHHSNLVSWQQLAIKQGARLKVADLDEQGEIVLKGRGEGVVLRKENGIEVGPLDELLDETVKLVAMTHVSNVLGTITPIGEVVSLVRKRAKEAVILIDGAQSVPHMPVDVGRLGADFLVFSGHKMLGPMGIGVLWGRKALLSEMQPFLFGGDMISEVYLSHTIWNRLPWKFEAGTPNVAGMVGLGAAVDYLVKIGMDKVREHEKSLTTYAFSRIKALVDDGSVVVYGVEDLQKRGGVVTFNVPGIHAHDAAQVLDSLGIAVRSGHHCAMPLTQRLGTSATVRASFYIYNTMQEIDKFIFGIEKVKEIFRLR